MSLSKIEIQIARPQDAREWARLRFLLWPDCPPERHALEVRQLLAAEGIVALAKVDGEMVGFAEVSIRRDHVEGTSISPVPYLEGWFVSEPYRCRGIGKSLLRFVEDWAREHGFIELASDAVVENEQSIRLHKLLGFAEVERTVHFVKRLNG